jgi:hypothetical protein
VCPKCVKTFNRSFTSKNYTCGKCKKSISRPVLRELTLHSARARGFPVDEKVSKEAPQPDFTKGSPDSQPRGKPDTFHKGGRVDEDPLAGEKIKKEDFIPALYSSDLSDNPNSVFKPVGSMQVAQSSNLPRGSPKEMGLGDPLSKSFHEGGRVGQSGIRVSKAQGGKSLPTSTMGGVGAINDIKQATTVTAPLRESVKDIMEIAESVGIVALAKEGYQFFKQRRDLMRLQKEHLMQQIEDDEYYYDEDELYDSYADVTQFPPRELF